METYKVLRYNRESETETIAEGLSLAEAKEYCNDNETHGEGWFCGYTKE